MNSFSLNGQNIRAVCMYINKGELDIMQWHGK